MTTAIIKYWHREEGKEAELVEKEITLPGSWEDVSWETYRNRCAVAGEDLGEKELTYKYLEIFTGMPADNWKNSHGELLTPILHALSWSFMGEPDLKNVPSHIEYSTKQFKVEGLLNKYTYDQQTSIQELGNQVFKAHEGEDNVGWKAFFHLFSKVVALLLQPHLDGTFPATNEHRIAELEEEINGWPCTIVAPLGAFFLKTHLGYGSNGGVRSQGDTQPMKSRQELESLKSLEAS